MLARGTRLVPLFVCLLVCLFVCLLVCLFACLCCRRTTTRLRVGAERNAGRPCVQHTMLGCNAVACNVRLQRCNRALASPRMRATVQQLPHATDAAGRPAACDALRAAAFDGRADGCRNQSRNVLHPPITRAHPAHVCAATGLTPPTSAPGLGSPRPHLRQDWAHLAHVCAATGLTLPTSAPEPASPLPHLQPDSARTPNARARAHARARARCVGWARRTSKKVRYSIVLEGAAPSLRSARGGARYGYLAFGGTNHAG